MSDDTGEEIKLTFNQLVVFSVIISILAGFFLGWYFLPDFMICHQLSDKQISANLQYAARTSSFNFHGAASDSVRVSNFKAMYMSYPQAKSLADMSLRRICTEDYSSKLRDLK